MRINAALCEKEYFAVGTLGLALPINNIPYIQANRD